MSTTFPVESGSLMCPACGTTLGLHGLDAVQEALCPECGAALRGLVFPASFTPSTPEPRFERAMEGEAVCFFHPTNRAVLPCDVCGRFLCTICDLPIGSRHLCPVCLSKGLGREKLPEIVPRRFLWSRTAMWLGLVPLCGLFIVLWPVLFVTGGSAVIIALLGWNRPGSLVRGRQRWAAVLGVLLGLVQVAIWAGMIYFVIVVAPRSR